MKCSLSDLSHKIYNHTFSTYYNTTDYHSIKSFEKEKFSPRQPLKTALCYNTSHDDIAEINIIAHEEENWSSLVWG